MRISVNVVASDVEISSDFIPLEVFDDMSLDAVKSFIEDEIRIPPEAQTFIHNNQQVTNNSQSLTQLGVSEGDVLNLMIRTKPPNQNRAQSSSTNTGNAAQQRRGGLPDAESMRQQLLRDPDSFKQLQSRDPEIAGAVNDPPRFTRLWDIRINHNVSQQREKEEMIRQLEADPFNIEAQTKIEEIIREERVYENLSKAMEENPESFGRVTMLYIHVLVNNTPIKAFVDSGAQSTIMSPEAAEKCGIMRLIDRRFGGLARGVGTARILGRVHTADIQIGQYSLVSSFTVMEGKGVDLLLGLDMLKRHQMCIDLKDNVLKIHDDSIAFLSESEIPKDFEEIADTEQKIEGPGGTQIGTSTGVVESKEKTKSPQSASTPGSGIRIHPQGSASNITSRAGSSQPQQAGPVTEQAIAQVTELGFSREEAITALQQANGNVEIAIGLLL